MRRFLWMICWGLFGMLQAQGLGNYGLSGTVVDSLSADPVVYATVRLMRNDTLILGVISDEAGKFEMKGLPAGKYALLISQMSYATKSFHNIQIGQGKTQNDVGKLLMATKDFKGPSVEITARQDIMLNTIDKKVYNVERNQLATGGGVSDVLKNIPSVEVDIDGNLSLRGSANVTVLIDGKPSALTGAGRAAVISQIPASSVKSIEVITNPSARYDPDGMAGIINIITKKDKAAGLNGNLSLGLGTHQKYNSSLGLNYRNKHFNAYGTYSFRREDRWGRGNSITTTPADTISPTISQIYGSNQRNIDHLARLGIDYYLSERSTIGLSGGWSNQDRKGQNISYFKEFSPTGLLLSDYDRLNPNIESNRTMDAELNFGQRFKQQGRSLDARLAYSKGANSEQNTIRTMYFLENGGSTFTPDDYLLNLQQDDVNLGTAQVDYVHLIGNKNKLETGTKLTSRDIQNDFNAARRDINSAEYLPDSLLINTFEYHERILAAYGIWSRNLSARLSMQLGARAEQAYTRSHLVGNDRTFTNNYFNLFPNAYANYRLKDKQDLRLSYSRRINRPTTQQLNPFTDYSNPKRLRVGNPELLPEYIDAFELSWGGKYKWGTLSSTAYFRYMSNSTTRYWQPISEGSDTLIMTFVNLLAGQSYGLEGIAEIKPTKWWECMLSLNVFRTVMNASNLEPDLTVDNLGMTSQFTSTFYIDKQSSLQLSANYRSPRYGPQGVFAAVFSSDVSYKRNILKGKGSLNFRMSDVFNTMRFKIAADTDLLISDNYRKRESRIGYVTFSYRFGKAEAGAGKRKRNNEERQGGGGGDMDF